MPLFVTTSNAPSVTQLGNNGYPIAFANDGNHIYVSNNGGNVITLHTDQLSVAAGSTSGETSKTIQVSKGGTFNVLRNITVNDHVITHNNSTLTIEQETPISGLTDKIIGTQMPTHNQTFDIITGIKTGGTNGHELTIEKSTVTIPASSVHTLSSPAGANTIVLDQNNASGTITLEKGTNISLNGDTLNKITISHENPTENAASKLTANSSVDATRGTTSVITALKRDAQGHVIDIESVKWPAQNHVGNHKFVTRDHNVHDNAVFIQLTQTGPTGIGDDGSENSFTIKGNENITVTQYDRLITLASKNTHVADHAFLCTRENNGEDNKIVVSLTEADSSGESTAFSLLSSATSGINLSVRNNAISIESTLVAGNNITLTPNKIDQELVISSSDTNTHVATHSSSIRRPYENVVDLQLTNNGANGDTTSDLWQFRGTGGTTVSSSENTVYINTPDVVNYGTGTASNVGPVHRIEVVSSLPSTKDRNTLYLVVS